MTKETKKKMLTDLDDLYIQALTICQAMKLEAAEDTIEASALKTSIGYIRYLRTALSKIL